MPAPAFVDVSTRMFIRGFCALYPCLYACRCGCQCTCPCNSLNVVKGTLLDTKAVITCVEPKFKGKDTLYEVQFSEINDNSEPTAYTGVAELGQRKLTKSLSNLLGAPTLQGATQAELNDALLSVSLRARAVMLSTVAAIYLTNRHVYAHVYTHAYTHVYTHVYTLVYTHVYTHVHTHVYTHACTHAYAHACMHAYTHAYKGGRRPGRLPMVCCHLSGRRYH